MASTLTASDIPLTDGDTHTNLLYMLPNTSPSFDVAAMLAGMEGVGLPSDAIREAAGIDPARLTDPDGRITSERIEAMWMAAAGHARDEYLALRVGAAVPFGAYSTLR